MLKKRPSFLSKLISPSSIIVSHYKAIQVNEKCIFILWTSATSHPPKNNRVKGGKTVKNKARGLVNDNRVKTTKAADKNSNGNDTEVNSVREAAVETMKAQKYTCDSEGEKKKQSARIASKHNPPHSPPRSRTIHFSPLDKGQLCVSTSPLLAQMNPDTRRTKRRRSRWPGEGFGAIYWHTRQTAIRSKRPLSKTKTTGSGDPFQTHRRVEGNGICSVVIVLLLRPVLTINAKRNCLSVQGKN